MAQIGKGYVSLDIVLFFVFIVLKVTKTVCWSWWWITSPLWIPAAICLGCYVIYYLGLIIMWIILKLIDLFS